MMFATAAMGTRFEIVIDELDSPDIRAIGEAAIAEIERLHRLLSFFAADSLVSHINRSAFASAVRIDAQTFVLLADALHVWHASGGAFDITRGTGMDAVELDAGSRTVRFTRRGVTIDLGGIAKGHAVDAAVEILRDNGVTAALVHGGTSSIAAIGSPRSAATSRAGNYITAAAAMPGWRVAVAPTLQTVNLVDQTLSASSGALRDHIVDPATGRYTRGPRIAAVIGPSARLGDAWSTAIAVLGVQPTALGAEWKTIIESTPDYESMETIIE